MLCGTLHCALWSIALCCVVHFIVLCGPLHCVFCVMVHFIVCVVHSIVFYDSEHCALWSIALCFVHYGPFIVLCDGYFTSCFVIHLIARCVGYLVFYFLVDLHCIVLYGAGFNSVGSLRDREVACLASDRQGSDFDFCVWKAVSSGHNLRADCQ